MPVSDAMSRIVELCTLVGNQTKPPSRQPVETVARYVSDSSQTTMVKASISYSTY